MAPHLEKFAAMNEHDRILVRDLVSRLHYPIREAVHRVHNYGDYHNRWGFDWAIKQTR